MSLRRSFFISLTAIAFALPSVCAAQQSARVPRIGYFHPTLSAPHAKARLNAFRERLRELGYVEGKNIAIEQRSSEGDNDRLVSLINELVRLPVDVLVADGGTLSVLTAKKATRTIPIVFPAAGDPVGDGLVSSLARPGGNVTGLTTLGEELSGKRLQLLKEVVPAAIRVAVLAHPSYKTHLPEAQRTATSLGLDLFVLEARNSSGINRVFTELPGNRPDVLLVHSNSVFSAESARIAEFALKLKLPTIGQQTADAESGYLATYGPDRLDLLRRTAEYVDRILKGAKPSDLPVEQPRKFELVINLKTAKAIGVTVPQAVLLRADKVIE
jgi:putative ABC transport system substrate-binding protein